MDITYQPPSYGDGPMDEAYVRFYVNSYIKVYESFWSYPAISALAEIGGYVGLLLGTSLMDISLLIGWFYTHYMKKRGLKKQDTCSETTNTKECMVVVSKKQNP